MDPSGVNTKRGLGNTHDELRSEQRLTSHTWSASRTRRTLADVGRRTTFLETPFPRSNRSRASAESRRRVTDTCEGLSIARWDADPTDLLRALGVSAGCAGVLLITGISPSRHT